MSVRPRAKEDEGPGTNAGVGWYAEGRPIEFRDGWDRFSGRRARRAEDDAGDLLSEIEDVFT